jgi:hypothetical protein
MGPQRGGLAMKNATLGHGVKILQLIDQKGIPGEQIQKIIGSGLLSDLLDANIGTVDRNEFRKLLGLNAFYIYHMTVDYSQSIEKAAKAGKYRWVNSDITSENFPTKRSGIVEVDIELVHFGRDMSTEEVLAELGKRGLRPAETHELLKLGEKFPDLQREFPIIALGSVCRDSYDDLSCPSLDSNRSVRVLYLYCLGGRWDGDYRFAALPK